MPTFFFLNGGGVWRIGWDGDSPEDVAPRDIDQSPDAGNSTGQVRQSIGASRQSVAKRLSRNVVSCPNCRVAGSCIAHDVITLGRRKNGIHDGPVWQMQFKNPAANLDGLALKV